MGAGIREGSLAGAGQRKADGLGVWDNYNKAALIWNRIGSRPSDAAHGLLRAEGRTGSFCHQHGERGQQKVAGEVYMESEEERK